MEEYIGRLRGSPVCHWHVFAGIGSKLLITITQFHINRQH
jgi:hypothetical protein